MKKREILEQVLLKNGGIAKSADFKAFGLADYELSYFYQKGIIHRIKQGYYQLAGDDKVNEELILSRLFPDGVICMDSALFFYGYSDRTPFEWTIAFRRNISRSRLKVNSFFMKAYFIPDDIFELGREIEELNQVALAIYDRERTICDCFKYRSKIDSEMFNKAVNAYVNDPKKNLGNLARYSKEMKLFNKVSSLVGVMVNG